MQKHVWVVGVGYDTASGIADGVFTEEIAAKEYILAREYAAGHPHSKVKMTDNDNENGYYGHTYFQNEQTGRWNKGLYWMRRVPVMGGQRG